MSPFRLSSTVGAGFLAALLLVAAPAVIAEPLPKSEAAEPTDAVPLSEGRKRRTLEQLLDECMEMWEPAVHMTKREWMQVCKRVTTEY